jgi:nicotinamide-nucleotide amidase
VRFGIQVVEKRVVGDSEEAVAAALADLLRRVDLVVLTGGLGPTADDVTREAVAAATGRELREAPEVLEWIRARYADLGREMPRVCRQMALVVTGSRPLLNSRGSAPGLLLEVEDRLVVALPGVPWEMETMLTEQVAPVLAERWPGSGRMARTLVLGGVMESVVEGRVRHLYDRFGRDRATILGSPGLVRLVLAGEGGQDLDRMETAFREVLGADVAGVDVGGLEEVVLGRLRGRGQTLATAESCTGGLVSAGLTAVAGASEVFVGGVVSYSNAIKERLLGVPRATLEACGAVSEEVARTMAAGARERLQADWGVAITGIAGPGGGTAEKPVGLVHWAVAGPGDVAHRQAVFGGGRDAVRRWSVNSVLDLLRRELEGEG